MSLDLTLTEKTDVCPHCGRGEEVWSENFNITHNLTDMAEAAGIYKVLWRPEEVGVRKASDITGQLQVGIELMEGDPDGCKLFNATNGWGLYKHFLPWVKRVCAACVNHPDATIEVSR